jgi:hypothetical protein
MTKERNMKKLMLLALAPLALLANPASAQTTVQRTVDTPSGTRTTTVTHMQPSARRTVVSHREVVTRRVTHRRGWHSVRRCTTKWRNHHRIRTCRMVRERY